MNLKTTNTYECARDVHALIHGRNGQAVGPLPTGEGRSGSSELDGVAQRHAPIGRDR